MSAPAHRLEQRVTPLELFFDLVFVMARDSFAYEAIRFRESRARVRLAAH